MAKSILAWHWSDGMVCRFDGRPIVVGETLRVESVEMCRRGLHASPRILHALYYAPGTTISRVRLTGRIERGGDKVVATERTCLWSVDARLALVVWAADCAERALERQIAAGREPDPRSWAVVEAARKWAADPTSAADAAWRAASADADAAAAAAAAADVAAERKWQSRRLRALIGAARRGEKLVPLTREEVRRTLRSGR